MRDLPPTAPHRPRGVLLGVAFAALLLLPAAALGGTPSRSLRADPSSVRGYWTPQRMRAAEPAEKLLDAPGRSLATADGPVAGADGPASYVTAAAPAEPARARRREGSPASARILGLGIDRAEVQDPTAADVRMQGKVFFTIPTGSEAGDYVCSGTSVNSRNRSVVLSAGHCVYDGEGGFATDWMFVPAYRDGVAPYGEWPARKLASTRPWKAAGDLHYDVGAAVVRRNSAGQRLGEVVGGRGIGFDQPRDLLYTAYGYPAVAPPIEFTGEREFRCRSGQVDTDQPEGGSGPSTIGIACDMTGGSSGGGWIARANMLVSVTSYGYPTQPDVLFGPYLSSKARNLYRSVKGAKKRSKRGSRGKGGKRGGKRR